MFLSSSISTQAKPVFNEAENEGGSGPLKYLPL
jgi:hypothetical protein